jgi:ATP-dependent Clp protease ATP-binding subunit ClpA
MLVTARYTRVKCLGVILQELVHKSRPLDANPERKIEEMVKKTSWICCALLGIGLFVASCGNAQKEATEAAINATQAAITAAQTEAAKYVPDQLQSAQTALQNAKDALAKGDYPAALSAAQDAASKAKDLAAAAAAKKAEWTQEWTNLSASMPKSLDEVKDKLNAYSHGAHMPAGMDKAKLADAKTQYDQLKQTWTDATAAATQGNLGDAMAKAASVKDVLAKLMEMLGIKS